MMRVILVRTRLRTHESIVRRSRPGAAYNSDADIRGRRRHLQDLTSVRIYYVFGKGVLRRLGLLGMTVRVNPMQLAGPAIDSDNVPRAASRAMNVPIL